MGKEDIEYTNKTVRAALVDYTQRFYKKHPDMVPLEHLVTDCPYRMSLYGREENLSVIDFSYYGFREFLREVQVFELSNVPISINDPETGIALVGNIDDMSLNGSVIAIKRPLKRNESWISKYLPFQQDVVYLNYLRAMLANGVFDADVIYENKVIFSAGSTFKGTLRKMYIIYVPIDGNLNNVMVYETPQELLYKPSSVWFEELTEKFDMLLDAESRNKTLEPVPSWECKYCEFKTVCDTQGTMISPDEYFEYYPEIK